MMSRLVASYLLHYVNTPMQHTVIFMAVTMGHITRKQTFYICENKDADQLRGDREADQRHCFRYKDSTIPLLSKSKISSI